MTTEEIQGRIDQIKKTALTDNGVAHMLEDFLLMKFIWAIKDNKYKSKKEVVELSKQVLGVEEIDFERGYQHNSVS